MQSPLAKEDDFRTSEDDLLNRGRRHPRPSVDISTSDGGRHSGLRASTSPFRIEDDISIPGFNISTTNGGRHSGLRKTTFRIPAETPRPTEDDVPNEPENAIHAVTRRPSISGLYLSRKATTISIRANTTLCQVLRTRVHQPRLAPTSETLALSRTTRAVPSVNHDDRFSFGLRSHSF